LRQFGGAFALTIEVSQFYQSYDEDQLHPRDRPSGPSPQKPQPSRPSRRSPASRPTACGSARSGRREDPSTLWPGMLMSADRKQCYMCDLLATSGEHVPPKCIFPEAKDVEGRDYRVDLITVPACDEHNLRKSKDDEFLMVCLAGIVGNNSIGFRHKLTKVNRAIRRTSNRLLNAAFRTRSHRWVEAGDNTFIEVIWGTPDYERLERCFVHIAFGLYYHQFNGRFHGQLRVLMGHLFHSDPNAAEFSNLIKHKAAQDLKDIERHGRNQDVFYYQFSDPDEHGLVTLRMCFYGGVNIFAAFMPDGTELTPNLSMLLINGGIETYINLGVKTFHFNKG
jgi:hypothetical protein